jgi:hypothetical protein
MLLFSDETDSLTPTTHNETYWLDIQLYTAEIV